MPIYIRITVDGLSKEVSIGRKCEPARWNSKSGRTIGTKEEFKKLNEFLDILQSKIYEARLRLIEKNEIVTSDLLRNVLINKEEKHHLLLETFKEHNSRMEALIINKEYAEGTLTHFKTTYAHLSEFIEWKYNLLDFQIEKIDYSFIADFEYYLKKDVCAHNTAMKYLGDLKKIILLCIKRGWLLRDPFLGYSIRRKEVQKDFLVEEELNSILKKTFSTERLSLVKDIFLFSCFTGLAYADVKKLKSTEIRIGIDGRRWLFIQRQKSSTPSPVPLLPFALQILDKYKDHPRCEITGNPLPIFSNQKMNEYLKDIADLCGIQKKLTYHTARHTFAYIFITKKPGNRKTVTSIMSGLLRKSIVPEQSMNKQLLQEFFESCGQFERILKDSGFVQLKRLDEDDLLSHPDRAGLIEKYCFLLEDEKSSIVKDIQFKDEFKIADAHCQLYTLADINDLPGLCGSRINYDKYSTDKTKFSVAFTSVLGQLLPCSHVYNQYIFIDDAQKAIRQLESKRLRLQSLSAYSRENSIAKEAVDSFLNEAISEQRQPVKAHFNLLVWTDDKERLKELRNLVSSALAQMDATPKQETSGVAQIWWAGMPGNEADFPMNDTFDTFIEQAVCFLNLETNYRSSLSPVGLRLGDRLSGKPVHVDISDEPVTKGICTNRNKFILGPSGSGKSFFTNHMVRSYYEQGTHIVLVDVGHSYKGLCDLVKGYYFTYSETDPIKFNPFYISSEDVLDTEKKESIKTLLLALWKKSDESYNRSEYVALSNALQLYYDKLNNDDSIFPCFNSFYEFLRDEFVNIIAAHKVKEKDFDISNFLYVLCPYYSGGEFDYLLNAKENLDLLKQRFIVFELDNIKDHPILFPVVTIIIMEVFISKMRKLKGVRKMILIEEAWKAIAKEGMAEYIKYLFKTVRKFYGEAIVVTQEIEDIISSPVVKQAIINNSDCKILLDQSKYQNKFDQIQELLGLTEKEKTLILSINKANDVSKKYKEVFISLGGVLSRVYRTEVSPEEYLAYTTEEREKVKVQEYAVKFGSMEKGIAALADDMKN